MFSRAPGVDGPFLQLKDTIHKWWNAECAPKLRSLFNFFPSLIVWQVWKWRNNVKHGGKLSVFSMMAEINRNLHSLAVIRYPWQRNISED